MQVKGITPLRHAAKRPVLLSLSYPVKSYQQCHRQVTRDYALAVSAACGPKIKYFALQSNSAWFGITSGCQPAREITRKPQRFNELRAVGSAPLLTREGGPSWAAGSAGMLYWGRHKAEVLFPLHD